jgi:tRNA G18 (ribose-2'-O)-methylase SpoU
MLGSCESLNVGFASTLVAYEARLQKFKNIKY